MAKGKGPIEKSGYCIADCILLLSGFVSCQGEFLLREKITPELIEQAIETELASYQSVGGYALRCPLRLSHIGTISRYSGKEGDLMQYRIDSRSGNSISILGFGCMRLPSTLGRINMEKTEKLFMAAIESGVNYFDTAYIYQNSEAAVGEILDRNNLRDKVFLATKLPILQCRDYADFERFFQIQLDRLRTDHVDYYFMHAVHSMEQWEKLCALGVEKWIQEKKSSGEIRQIGFSYHGSKDDFMALLDAYDWDFCQIQYNYTNINYQAGMDGLKRASEKGLPVFIMEPLLGGRLATGLPPKAEALLKRENKSASPASWALRWLWNQPEVTMVLSGMNEPMQVEDNIQTANHATPGMLSQQERDTINQVIDIYEAAYKVPCTGCNYCMPCPKGINIPACFSAYNTSHAISRFTGVHQYIMSTGAMSGKPHGASGCAKCGKCEQHCPQHIPIRDSLEDVAKRMEPLWYRAAASLAGLVYARHR